jgi:hypothetical protein
MRRNVLEKLQQVNTQVTTNVGQKLSESRQLLATFVGKLPRLMTRGKQTTSYLLTRTLSYFQPIALATPPEATSRSKKKAK